MKTLADMTTKERDKCPGKWCYIFERLDEPPIGEGIIAGYRESDDGKTIAIINHPHPNTEKWGCDLDKIVPRDDLPRAWNADGTPPQGEWQTAKMKVTLNENTKYDAENNIISGDVVADPDHEPRSAHDIRCWLSYWEEI